MNVNPGAATSSARTAPMGAILKEALVSVLDKTEINGVHNTVKTIVPLLVEVADKQPQLNALVKLIVRKINKRDTNTATRDTLTTMLRDLNNDVKKHRQMNGTKVSFHNKVLTGDLAARLSSPTTVMPNHNGGGADYESVPLLSWVVDDADINDGTALAQIAAHGTSSFAAVVPLSEGDAGLPVALPAPAADVVSAPRNQASAAGRSLGEAAMTATRAVDDLLGEVFGLDPSQLEAASRAAAFAALSAAKVPHPNPSVLALVNEMSGNLIHNSRESVETIKSLTRILAELDEDNYVSKTLTAACRAASASIKGFVVAGILKRSDLPDDRKLQAISEALKLFDVPDNSGGGGGGADAAHAQALPGASDLGIRQRTRRQARGDIHREP